MYKFIFYVPLSYAEKVKQAVFSAGGGHLGDYAECSWECLGVGQFRPLANSHPFIGSCDKLEKVEELKVEMLCEEHVITEVLRSFKGAHPYEAPAYEVIKLENF